ncbi:hypothetical protein [Nocardioides ultimimeridianus]
MTEGRDFPPPGGFPPPPGAPLTPPVPPAPGAPAPPGQPPEQQWAQWAQLPQRPGPGVLAAVHRPGAVPLRPLNLGAMYDGAFRIIRYNPRATIGATVLVCALFMVIPVLVSSVTAALLGATYDITDPTPSFSTGDLISLVSLLIGGYGSQLGLIVVTGMIAHVTHAAAVGRRLTLAEAWAATHGKRWRLIGLAILLSLCTLGAMALVVGSVVLVGVTTQDTAVTVIVGIVLGICLLVAMVMFWTRVILLSSVALMLEPVGVIGAMRRAVALTRSQFWRVLGVGLLTVLVAGFAGGIISTPVTIIGEVILFTSPAHALLVISIMSALSSIVSNAFTAPFKASVATLQYLDQRIRKEGYDVELMRQAGLLDR